MKIKFYKKVSNYLTDKDMCSLLNKFAANLNPQVCFLMNFLLFDS